MKHGDKAKAKSAKTKASGKDAGGPKVVAKSSKGADKAGGKAVKAGGQKDAVKAVAKSSPPGKGDNGKGKTARPAPVVNGGFSNPVIGEAFRRAVKKYPSAFRRLTD